MSMKKLSAFAVAAFMLVAVAVPASAETVDVAALMQQIAQLQAQLVALQGGSTTSTGGYTFTRDLTIGSTGADVTELQKVLVAKGYLAMPAGAAYGYFGTLTQAAVAKWQVAEGITPAAGYFGAISRGKANAMASTSTGTGSTGSTSTGSATLSGGAGEIEDVDVLSIYGGEEVLEGESDAKVMAFEIEASDDSDIAIDSLRLKLKRTGASSASSRMNRYIDAVSVMVDGKTVGSADARDFSESSDVYSKSVSLSNVVIKKGETKRFVVAIDAISNIDSDDLNENWTVGLESVRFRDGSGAILNETSAGDLSGGINLANNTADNAEKLFTFEDLSSSGDLEIRVREDSSSPDAGVVEVSDTSDTNDVVLLATTFTAKGSDMTIDEIGFDVTPTGANANEIVKEFKLVVDGKEIDSVSPASIASGATASTTFSNLADEFVVEEGDTVTVKLVADINDLEGSFGDGDSIVASFTSGDFNDADIEDGNGDQVAAGDRVGTVTGETQTFFKDGVNITFVSGNAKDYTVDSSNNDYTDLFITFKVTAIGEDAYIPNILTNTSSSTSATGGAPTTAQGIGYHLQFSTAGVASSSVTAKIDSSTADEKTNSYKVVEGATETFTMKVTVTNTQGIDGAQYRAILTGINFADTDSATGDTVFTGNNMQQDFKSTYGRVAD